MMLRHSLLFPLLFIAMLQVDAGNLVELQVSDDDGIYHVKMVMEVHAPADYVRGVLTDYVHIYRLNPSIAESEILPSPGKDVVRVRTMLDGCVGFFCQRINRVEDIHKASSDDLAAEIVPDQSDMKSGRVVWKIHAVGDQTLVSYQGYMEPAFFIPPLIGSYFVKKIIRNQMLTSFTRLECIARVQARQDALQARQLASLETVAGCDAWCVKEGGNCQ